MQLKFQISTYKKFTRLITLKVKTQLIIERDQTLKLFMKILYNCNGLLCLALRLKKKTQ